MRNNIHIKIYVKIYLDAHKMVISKFNFSDLIEYTPIPLNNILLLKSDYIGENRRHNFELLEGKRDIAKMIKDKAYSYGDFCFTDYEDIPAVEQLSDEQIAELLYMAHLYKPLNSPFFEVLKNNFVYLGHDDGWYCKIYCKEKELLNSLLLNKLRGDIQQTIKNKNTIVLPNKIVENTLKFSVDGLLIELEKQRQKSEDILIRFYKVGEYKDIDKLLNIEKFDDTSLVFEQLIEF